MAQSVFGFVFLLAGVLPSGSKGSARGFDAAPNTPLLPCFTSLGAGS